MAAKVTRRDFLNGAAIGAGGLLLYGCGSDTDPSMNMTTGAPTVFSAPDSSAYYPPYPNRYAGQP